MLKATFNIGRLALPILLAAAVIAVLAFAFLGGTPETKPPVAASRDAQHLVAILQYLESDYPAAVASRDAAELAEQRFREIDRDG